MADAFSYNGRFAPRAIMTASTHSNAVLSCQHLSKSHIDGTLRVDVLQDIDLKILKGEKVAIIGASGSGKSTLLHLLGGLDSPSRGQVHIGGVDVQSLDQAEMSKLRNHYLGFVYQFHHLLPEFTVLENVCLPLLIRGGDRDDMRQQAIALLERVGLKNRIEHKLGEISGGERQRTAIARALITKPLCILADEPTGNLDWETADSIMDLFEKINKEGKTIIMATHHKLIVNKLKKRVIKLKDGRIVTKHD